MSKPAPRPALKKSADAHVHPAAPGHSLNDLRPAPDSAEPTTGPEVAPAAGGAAQQPEEDGQQPRLSGPLRGNTSDSLRAATRKARRRPRGADTDKLVDLNVRVPKKLRKQFRAAVKGDKKDPDAVVTALLKAWLDA